jgi:hypothetical protein
VANSKLQVESDIVESGTYVWYDLLTSLTSTRLIFDTWWDNTAKRDLLLFCDGTDNLKYWTGAIAQIVSTTVNTITFANNAATYGFSTSGTVLIGGVEFTYSGISGTDLTGVADDPTGNAAGSVVLEKPVTDADTVEANYLIDFIRVVGNQLYCASETSRLVYMSKNDDFDDFTSASPRAVGEGDIIVLDETPTGIGIRNGKAHIGTKKAWYIVSFNQITVGSNLTEQTLVEKVPMTAKKGALRHEFIQSQGNDLVYLSEDQQVHIFGNFPNFSEPQFPSISDDIETELGNEDFTSGHMRIIGEFLYLTAPQNGRVWVHENRSDRMIWHAPFIWKIARIALINGVEYGYSNANPQIYQLWDTNQWSDDSPSDEPLPYDCVAAFPYFRGDRYNKVFFDSLFIEGYLSPGTNLYSAMVYEYQGEQAVQTLIINKPIDDIAPDFYIGDIGTALGDASLGDQPLGDSITDEEIEQELLPKFRTMLDCEEQHVFEYQPRVYSDENDSRWEILCLGTNESISDETPTELKQ